MISTATLIDDTNVDKSILEINSKARIKFIEDEDEAIVTLVTTMDLDPENMRKYRIRFRKSIIRQKSSRYS